jgi:hypothetical protein
MANVLYPSERFSTVIEKREISLLAENFLPTALAIFSTDNKDSPDK